MGIVLDIIVIAIVGLTVFSAARYGFVRTVIELIGYCLAFVLITSISFTDPTAIIYRTVLLIVLIVLVKIAAKLLNKLFSFSFVGKINTILGGLLGIPKGIVIAAAFCLLTLAIIKLTDGGFWFFTNDAIKSSYIFSMITKLPIFR